MIWLQRNRLIENKIFQTFVTEYWEDDISGLHNYDVLEPVLEGRASGLQFWGEQSAHPFRRLRRKNMGPRYLLCEWQEKVKKLFHFVWKKKLFHLRHWIFNVNIFTTHALQMVVLQYQKKIISDWWIYVLEKVKSSLLYTFLKNAKRIIVEHMPHYLWRGINVVKMSCWLDSVLAKSTKRGHLVPERKLGSVFRL